MALQRMLGGDSARNSKIYLAIGAISLVKALAVRHDRERFRRELLDAGLFLGVGALLYRYSKLKAEKREELTEQLPAWVSGEAGTSVATAAKRRLASESEPASERTLAARAKRAVGGR